MRGETGEFAEVIGPTGGAPHPGTGVIVLSQYDDPEYAVSLLAEGSAGYGYLLKDRLAEGDQLIDAIRRTLAHSRVVALEFTGDYYDLGTVAGYLKANLALAMTRKGIRDDLLPLLRHLLQE